MNNKWQQETVNTERFNKTDLLRDSSWYIQLVRGSSTGYINSNNIIQLTENCKHSDIKVRGKTESCLTFISYKLTITWIFSLINLTVLVCFVSPKFRNSKQQLIDILDLPHSFSFLSLNRDADQHLSCNSV